MGLSRSEDMYLYKFAITKDNVWQVITRLGLIQGSHFLDMNKEEQVFRLPYTTMVKRCEESERKLQLIDKECQKYKVELVAPLDIDQLEMQTEALSKKRKKAMHMLFEDVERDICEKQEFIEKQVQSIKNMHEVLNELQINKLVLDKANKIIHGKFNLIGVSQNSIQVDDENAIHNRSLQQDDGYGGINFLITPIERRHSNPIHSQIEQSFREVSICYMAGTIEKEDVLRFRKLIYRVSRGTLILLSKLGRILVDIEDLDATLTDYHGNVINQSIYILVFQEGHHFREKMNKLCDSFMGKRVELPSGGHCDNHVFRRKITEIQKKINDTKEMLRITKVSMKEYLNNINNEPEFNHSVMCIYKQFVRKERAIYQIMNQLARERNLFHGYFWSYLPKYKIMERVYEGLQKSGEHYSRDNIFQLEEVSYKRLKPPTFFKMNEFTSSFQEIVNTYGIPIYKEFNPTIFTIITFPFLFGIMFGDVGHGGVLFLVASIMCLFNSRIGYAIPSLKLVLKARYLFLLMGLFAFYCGLMYNDFMAMPLNLFDTCYPTKEQEQELAQKNNTGSRKLMQEVEYSIFGSEEEIHEFWRNLNGSATNNSTSTKPSNSTIPKATNQTKPTTTTPKTGKTKESSGFYSPKRKENCVYLVGIDTNWMISKNELNFMNSLKMKVAVILGVTQMALGVFLKAINNLYFKDYLSFFNEFIPQILLLLLIFGYMDILIIVKWMTDYSGREHEAPSVITTMINIPLNGAKIEGLPFIGTQAVNQMIGGLCVPWMLFVKPYVLKKRHENQDEHQHHLLEVEMANLNEKPPHYQQFEDERDVIEEVKEDPPQPPAKLNLEDIKIHYQSNESHVIEIMNQKEHEEFVFSEVFIHQMIETIEFVLGTVSNTASYLRLWALSLAHSQLAKVFFEKTIVTILEAEMAKNNKGFFLVITYFVWVNSTLFVLMSMDVMECFLHTLRLHWVEFQNKFYKGVGYKFTPFTFDSVFHE